MRKNLSAIIAVGVILGLLTGISGLQLAWWHFALGAFIFFVIFILFYIINANRFLRHMKLGEYEKALILLNKQKHFGRDAFKDTLLNITQLNKAICYNRMGEFTRSIEELDKINLIKIDKNTSWSFYGLYAVNLLMLEDRLDEATDYIQKAHNILGFSSSYLVWCNLEQINGNFSIADELMRTYENNEEVNKRLILGKTFLLIDQKFKVIYDNFLIGLYYFNKKESEKAVLYLKLASKSENENYYSNKAIEIIKTIENYD